MEIERLTDEIIERVLGAALAQRPPVPIGAMAPDGWFMEPPASLPVADELVLRGETALELAVPEDRARIVAGWAKARAVGGSHVQVRLLEDPTTPVVMQFIDARHLHGVFVVAILPESGSVAADGSADGVVLAPRYCWLRRDGLAYIIEADAASELMFGWSAAAMVGQKSIDFIHADDHDRAIDNWLEMLSRPGQSSRWRARYLTNDGSSRWVEITNHNRLEDPEHGDVLTEILDVGDEMAMHEALRASEELFRELTHALPVGVLQVDQAEQSVFANERLTEIVGGRRIESLDDWRACLVSDDAASFDAVLDVGNTSDLELRLRQTDANAASVCHVSLRRLQESGGQGLLLCVTDVTESANLRDELEIRATFDALTGCHNRSSTLRQLAQLLRSPDGPGAGVVFIDLDRFKPINDQMGHAAGDAILMLVAERLSACTRARDIVGRLGGDEFVVLSPGAGGGDLARLARRVQRTLDESAVLGTSQVPMSASVGVAEGRSGDSPEAVLAAADAAMYRAKRVRNAAAN